MSVRPRNIRDIAHLYLSRHRPREPSPTLNLFVTSGGSDCFPGLHTANLAVAFARRRATVHVFELSGLLPNASFYLAHPPEVYVASALQANGTVHSALSGVSVSFSVAAARELPTATNAGPTINIVHLPARGGWDVLSESWERRDDVFSGQRWGLVMHRERSMGVALSSAFPKSAALSRRFLLSVCDESVPPRATATTRDLGGLVRWTENVADRVPVVLREPNAPLSRDYLSICDSMLSQMSRARRSAVASKRG